MHFWLNVGCDGDIVSHTYTVTYGDTHCDVAYEEAGYTICVSFTFTFFMVWMFGYWWIWLPRE